MRILKYYPIVFMVALLLFYVSVGIVVIHEKTGFIMMWSCVGILAAAMIMGFLNHRAEKRIT